MTDTQYVPTTDEVRECYVQSRTLVPYYDVAFAIAEAERHGAEFDAWLTAHDAQVRAGALLSAAAAIEAEGADFDAESTLALVLARLRARAAGAGERRG